MRIFVSYRQKDSADSVSRLVTRLRQRRDWVTFRDVDQLPPADRITPRIVASIQECDVFLLVVGHLWAAVANERGTLRLEDSDDPVRCEIEVALAAKRKIVPVLVMGASPPDRAKVPACLHAAIDCVAVHLRPDPHFERDLLELMTTLGMRVSVYTANHAPLPPLPRPYLERAAIEGEILRSLRGSTWWARLLRRLGRRRSRPLWVLHGPPGTGKSALAIAVAQRFRDEHEETPDVRVYYCAWPQRLDPSDGPRRGDLAIIDGVELGAGHPADALDWLLELPCAILVTSNDKAVAERLAVRGGKAKTAVVSRRLTDLREAEARKLLSDNLPAAAYQTLVGKGALQLEAVKGRPFYLRVLVDLASSDALPSIDAGEPSAIIRRIEKAWVAELRRCHPDRYRVLAELSLVAQYGTSSRLLARLSGLDVAQVAGAIDGAVSAGYVRKPLIADDYYTPHELVRASFNGVYSKQEIRSKRSAYLVAAREAIEKPNGARSFAGTLDAYMQACVRAFNEKSELQLADIANKFASLAGCNFPECPPTEVLRWLSPWIAGQIFDSCSGVIAVARSLQHVQPRSEVLGDVMFRAIGDDDTYAVMEAILAVVAHVAPGDGPRDELAARLATEAVAKIAKPRRGPSDQDTWFLALELYAFACAIARLTGDAAMAEKAHRWKALVRPVQRKVVTRWLDLAIEIRVLAAGGPASGGQARDEIRDVVRLFARLETAAQRHEKLSIPNGEIETTVDLAQIVARSADWQRLSDFLFVATDRWGQMDDGRHVISCSVRDFIKGYRDWYRTKPRQGG